MVDTNFALSVKGFNEMKAKAEKNPQDDEALRQAAVQFESMLVGSMLKSMRDSVQKSDLLSSSQMDQYNDMMDQQWTQHLSGNFGVADMLVEQLQNKSKISPDTPE